MIKKKAPHRAGLFRSTCSFYRPVVGEAPSAGLPDGLLGSAGFPDGFIALGLLAVLPTVPELPVVMPGELPVALPADGVLVAPGDMVPADVPLPLAPAEPLAWANATVLDSASAPANAKVVSFMVVSFG